VGVRTEITPFADLHGVVVSNETLDSMLQRVSELAVKEVEHCDFAGITLMREGRPVTSAYTDLISPEVDQAQYDSDTGPCLDAFRYNEQFRIDDTQVEERWPEFARAASERGIRSTLSIPLMVGEAALGALNLYSLSVGAFVDPDSASLFGSQAAVVLANAQAYWAAQHLADHLDVAIKTRAVIEQAKGILIARHDCTADEAFDMLSRVSQHTNTKLRDVAAQVVADPRAPLPAS